MAKTKNSETKSDKKTADLSTGGGVIAGAALGSLLGPIGAAVGAVVGGIAGAKVAKRAQAKPKPNQKHGGRTRLKSATKKVLAKRPARKKKSAKRKH